MVGVSEVASLILDKQVRLGRPKGIVGLPDVLRNPAYSSCVGMLLFAMNYAEKKPRRIINKPMYGNGGTWGKIFSWFKQDF